MRVRTLLPYACQLESAILNLALNARDAMPNGGALTIETRNEHAVHPFVLNDDGSPAAEHVRVAVRDTGIGMSETVAARAFEPFFTTKEVGKGTGLGLSQVYGFVKQSRGHVELSTRPAAGTTVKLCLPRFIGPVSTSDTTDVSCLSAPGGTETILLVEDDEQVRIWRLFGSSVTACWKQPTDRLR